MAINRLIQRRRRIHRVSTAILWLTILGCALFGCAHFESAPSISAVPWPAADVQFRNDQHWLGGDGAYSIDLGHGRVLWLFGDSFIADGPNPDRQEADIIRNSLAIQEGYDPSSAKIKFYWGRQAGGPAAFFPGSNGAWLWPGGGVLLKDRLILYFMKIRETDGPLGFEAFGWTAMMIENPKDEPCEWKVHHLVTPANDFGVLVGSASVLKQNGYVYAFSVKEPSPHDVYLVRWPVRRMRYGDLSNPEWWTGPSGGWVRQQQLAQRPAPLFTEGQNEFSVHFERSDGRYWQVQTMGFGSASMVLRTAGRMTGPWSGPKEFYRPIEAGRANILIYAGKSHPELIGADLVLTYMVNSLDFDELLDDDSIYYPVFLKGAIR